MTRSIKLLTRLIIDDKSSVALVKLLVKLSGDVPSCSNARP